MNISTYESRIKALEDQLNPPAPSGDTGLLSVVVSPDITLSDGTSLKAKLEAMMPIKWEDGVADDPEYPEDRTMTIDFFTKDPIGAPATVTVKPSQNRYALYVSDNRPVFGQLGQEVTFDATAADNGLHAQFGVADSGNIDTAKEVLHINMNVGPR